MCPTECEIYFLFLVSYPVMSSCKVLLVETENRDGKVVTFVIK